MELRVLRYFLAVAQQRNITKAARELLVSQPTLSKQLADLERELGVKASISKPVQKKLFNLQTKQPLIFKKNKLLLGHSQLVLAKVLECNGSWKY